MTTTNPTDALLRPPAPVRAADAVVLEGVVAAVGGFPVLAGVDLRVARGETVLVSGANGAGKTSLLRLLAGMLPVTAGCAHVLGYDLGADRSSHRRGVAFVAQDTFCYDDLSVRRNLRLHAMAAATGDRAADEALEIMGLASVADLAHGRLSTGQRRRCALAVGLCRRPSLLLLDEPHAGLDPAARGLVGAIVGKARERATTVVLVSHDLEIARQLADREVLMADGCVL